VARRLLSLAILLACTGFAQAAPPAGIVWEPFGEAAFARAAQEGRFVLLDLEAVWCHWCHVMDATTYRDARVVQLVRAKYVAVRVDEDSAPELAVRYGDWGWPATIVLAPDGSELVKRRGYLPPAAMAALLKAIIEDPTPGPSVEPEDAVGEGPLALTPERRVELRQLLEAAYDTAHGGWGQGHRLLQPGPLELTLLEARAGDAAAAARATRTLAGARQLVDPVWGGVSQYSEGPDWTAPHFEKLLSVQAEAIGLFAHAAVLLGRPEYLETARAVERYVHSFLASPEGVFFISQDADVGPALSGHAYYALPDAERRRLGMPRVDRHLYAKENAELVTALVALHDATLDAAVLADAARAEHWLLHHRQTADGGIRHGEAGAATLGDTLSVAEAALALYASTAERPWLAEAERAADFIRAHFSAQGGAGFVSTLPPKAAKGVFAHPVLDAEENVQLARFAVRLFAATGKASYREMAEAAVRSLTAAGLAERRGVVAGLLLCDVELATEPVHLTVVGAKDDVRAQALFSAVVGYPALFRRTEWWDAREGPLPRGDVVYPKTTRAAAFVCGRTACSLPVYEPEAVAAAADRLLRPRSN
jgi:uncharacterized protein YyaL (SSP411 family)